MDNVHVMHSQHRNQSLLQVTYDQANQQWILHIGESNSVAIVRDGCSSVAAEDALTISDFGGPSSRVLELALPCGEVIRQEFAAQIFPDRQSPFQEMEEMDDAVPIVIAD
ncbi:MAG: hypothetical protein ACI9R3_006431 [Verrucomicrobiales bacterium]|jgi:hypothetical protein